MQEIFEAFLSSWLLCFSIVYMWNYLTKRSFQLTNYKLYALTTLLYLAGIVGNNMVVIYLKFLLITTLFAVIYKLFYKSNVQESIITVIFVQLVITISEFIGVFVIGVVFQYDLEKFMNEIFGAAFFNIITIILSILIVKIPIVLKIYNYILDFTKHIKRYQTVLITLILAITISILMSINYFNLDYITTLIINFTFLLIYTGICIAIMKEKNTSEIYRIGYEEQQKALQDNVLLLDQECMKNHENVNQLYTIEGLARNNDTKGILEYIGVVIKEKKQEDNTLTRRIKRIPLATIQGLIYPKLGIMKDNDIDFQVVLARNIKEFDFTKIDMKTNMELCKVLGVLIDNAIDEVTKLEDRKIKLELFCKNGDLHIDVSNNYGKLLDNMDEVGVTSKEGLHGYGLGIIAQITKQNPKLQNQKKINANRFHQIVIVSNSIDNKKKNV
mgnify:CR=1 FL=1